MKKPIAEGLARLADEGSAPDSTYAAELWSKKASAFLRAALGDEEADKFLRIETHGIMETHALRLGHVQGMVAKSESESATKAEDRASQASEEARPTLVRRSPDSRKVFVVHGHDSAAKEGAARFLERLSLQPIILHEQPSSGRTIIEKFETYSGDIAFAVVLLTPDDAGGVAGSTEAQPRARQNVILELGYFMGRLGRQRVCALHKGGVELPSDYQGVLYIEMDSAGAWKAKLAQEFVQAKLPIDLSGLLGG